jgi:hypothetical protein
MPITKNISFVVENKRDALISKSYIYFIVDWVSLCSKVGVMLTNRDKPFFPGTVLCTMNLKFQVYSKSIVLCKLGSLSLTMVGKLPNLHI